MSTLANKKEVYLWIICDAFRETQRTEKLNAYFSTKHSLECQCKPAYQILSFISTIRKYSLHGEEMGFGKLEGSLNRIFFNKWSLMRTAGVKKCPDFGDIPKGYKQGKWS